MTAETERNPYVNNSPVAPQVLQFISRFSKNRRNEVRGTIGLVKKYGLTPQYIEILRANSSEADMYASACVLEAPFGLRARKVNGLSQKDLWVTYEGKEKALELEIAYVCGFLNSWKSEVEKAVGTIRLLSSITRFEFEDGCNAIKACAEEWGASKYLCYKIALLKNVASERDLDLKTLKEVDVVVGHDDSPSIQYSVIENVLPSISIFSVAKRHTNTLKSKLGAGFRSRHSLSNLVSTPFSNDDAAGFLRRNLETSLLDTVHAVWVILNLCDRFHGSREALRRNLDPDLFARIEESRRILDREALPKLFEETSESSSQAEDLSLKMYRQSSIFLEFPRICRFRNDLDRVIGLRLVASLLPKIQDWPCDAGEKQRP